MTNATHPLHPASDGSQQQQQQLPPHSDNIDEELRRINLAMSAVFSPSPSSNSADYASSSSSSQQQQQQQQWWAQRQLANRYLTSFQTTALAWMVCDRILQEGDSATPATTAATTTGQDAVAVQQQQQQRRFFAAQTLHTKCRNDIFELPPETLPSLRDSMLHHLQRYSTTTTTTTAAATPAAGDNSNVALTTRLAMCISALAVQMNWTTIVTDLLTNYGGTVHEPMVMAILRVLPEECASDRLVLLDDNNRFLMRDHLVASAPAFLQHLQHGMTAAQGNQQQPHQQPHQQVLETLHTWIRYVPILPNTLAETPLLQECVRALTQRDFLEPAADVVVEILRMYPSHLYNNEGLVRRMIPLLLQLPYDQALASDDEDVLLAYCRVVTEMGESYMSIILSKEHHREASQLVNWVLHCSSIADSEIASITLHFWYRMVIDLEGVDPFDWRQELIDMYTPHLLQLIDVCVNNLMRYPSDVESIAQDKVDDIERHRFYVAETVEDCCRLLGGHMVLKRIGESLKVEVQKVAGDHHRTGWQGIESNFACISAIHRFVPSDENEFLPFCFGLIPQLPTDIGPLRYTASKLIGKFASWLAVNSSLLQPLLPYLTQGLSDTDCAPAAAIAIKELCECSNQSFDIAEPVLQLYLDISSAQGVRLPLQDELQILEGTCRALSRKALDRREDGSPYVERLAHPIVTRLSSAVSDPNASAGRVIAEIERLTIVVQFLKTPVIPINLHPIVKLFQSCWSLLETSTARFPSDNHLSEKICRLHKHALRSCGAEAYEPMLNALIQQLVHSFERSRQSPFLYAASICITEYGPNPAYTQRLYDMVANLSTITFSFVRNLEDMTNHPDVVEEFFYLMGRMMNHCPDPIVRGPLLQSLVKCAIVGTELDHQGANKGTLRFLEDTISHGLSLREMNRPDSQAALEQVLSQEGQHIVANLARALTGDLPAYNERQIPEILWKLNLLCPSLLSQWLAFAFHRVDRMPERAKADFMGALDTGLARDEFSLAVRAFQTACQRERRTRRLPHNSAS